MTQKPSLFFSQQAPISITLTSLFYPFIHFNSDRVRVHPDGSGQGSVSSAGGRKIIMTKKLWAGRFSEKTRQEVDEFNASIHFDYKLWPYDITGSIAHVKMLAKQKIISKAEASKIEKGLESIAKDIQNKSFKWKVEEEDIHLNIEAELIRRIGPVGGKLHTARSRNDQVATDVRLYCRHKIHSLFSCLIDFQRTLLKLAQRYSDTILPGYTHLQRAQPILLAHHLLAYFEMAQRDKERLTDLLKRVETLPLGSGALAGTTFPIDRQFVAKELGFKRVCANSLDAVSDRDFVVEFLSACALILMHLSRFSEEMILWTTTEFNFVKLPEGFCTGSSMMPQKVNPDVPELIRGKTGRCYGNLMSLLSTLKGLPLAYNKDMQEDKEPLFDSAETTETCLKIFTQMLEETSFKEDVMLKATQEGFLLATDIADYLASKGLPFREAHHVAGKLVRFCQEEGLYLEKLDLKNLKRFSSLFEADVHPWINLKNSVNRRKSYGGTASSQVQAQIRRAQKILSSQKPTVD